MENFCVAISSQMLSDTKISLMLNCTQLCSVLFVTIMTEFYCRSHVCREAVRVHLVLCFLRWLQKDLFNCNYIRALCPSSLMQVISDDTSSIREPPHCIPFTTSSIFLRMLKRESPRLAVTPGQSGTSFEHGLN